MFDSTKLMSTSDDFVTLRESNSYFVDKTMMIKKEFTRSAFSKSSLDLKALVKHHF